MGKTFLWERLGFLRDQRFCLSCFLKISENDSLFNLFGNFSFSFMKVSMGLVLKDLRYLATSLQPLTDYYPIVKSLLRVLVSVQWGITLN